MKTVLSSKLYGGLDVDIDDIVLDYEEVEGVIDYYGSEMYLLGVNIALKPLNNKSRRCYDLSVEL